MNPALQEARERLTAFLNCPENHIEDNLFASDLRTVLDALDRQAAALERIAGNEAEVNREQADVIAIDALGGPASVPSEEKNRGGSKEWMQRAAEEIAAHYQTLISDGLRKAGLSQVAFFHADPLPGLVAAIARHAPPAVTGGDGELLKEVAEALEQAMPRQYTRDTSCLTSYPPQNASAWRIQEVHIKPVLTRIRARLSEGRGT